MTRRARDTFTGQLRPNDPRRFLVEAMLGAMCADGKIHEAEMIAMQKHLEEHEMFAGLEERHHTMLLEIARDAISFAVDPALRIPAIAKGLPSRLHKLTALSMACEVVIADTFVDELEVIYLKKLRRALRLDSQMFEEMFQAAKDKRSLRDLDDRVAHLRKLVPNIVELFALRSLSMSTLHPGHRAQMVELLVSLPDIGLRIDELTAVVEKAYSRMHFALDLEAEIAKIANTMPHPVDRYWAVVYLMCADTINAINWRANPFLTTVQRVFGLDPADCDLAPVDAVGFASYLPRVG